MIENEEIINDLYRAKKFFENIISYTIGPYTLEDMIKYRLNSINIIDVRDYNDYLEGHLPYAINFPISDIKANIDMLDKSKVNILYSYSDTCKKAYKTAINLLENNFPVVILRGGYKAWEKAGFDIIKNCIRLYPID